MSLKQFLAVGRSVVGMREDRSPYQMRAATLLPKFESPARNISELEMPAPEPTPQAKTKRLNFLKGLNPFRRGRPTQKQKSEDSVVPASTPDRKEGKSIFRKSFFPARSKGQGEFTKQVRTLVQSELSLDAVRVVRNDLCDTDLEIVACFRQREAAMAKGELAQDKPQALDGQNHSAFAKAAAQPGWSRLTARLFDTSGIGRA
jgi:hypothetical protein